MFLHISGSPQLFVTNVTLMIATNIVSLGHVILVVSLVVELRLASLAGVGLGLSSADLHVCFQVTVADKLLFTHFTLKSLSL